MIYREFGKTGKKLSLLGFGAMRLPQVSAEEVNMEESIKIIHRAFELGVNIIDTAPYYCNGQSEIAVGKALKGWRDKVYLSTKNAVFEMGGEKEFRQRLEVSLKKLDVDYIDFYHMWSIRYDLYKGIMSVPGGAMAGAFKAREEGLIKHIGFSVHDKPENLHKLLDTGEFETVICQYNLLDRSNENEIAYAREKGIGVMTMGPLGGGRLATPSEYIRNLLPDKKINNTEIGLRFAMANSNTTSVLSGMSSIEMVEENVRIASNENPLTKEEYEAVKSITEECKKLADLYCTGCNYCMPCPNEVNIPLNFQLMNLHKVYHLTDFARSTYSRIGTGEWLSGTNALTYLSGKKADECNECGLCESKCPQGIQIRKQLKEVAEALK